MKSDQPKSLIQQVVFVVVLTQLACALLLCSVAVLHEYHTRLRAMDESIHGRSDSLLGAIQDAEDPEDNVTIDPSELHLPNRDVYAVYNQGSRMLGSSPNPQAALIQRRGDGFRTVQVDHTGYRVFEREAMRIIDRSETSGIGLRRPVTIVYAVPKAHLWHEIFEALSFYFLSIVMATGIAIVLVIFLLRRSLVPLDELAAATERLSLPTLHFDPPPSVVQVRELRPMAVVLSDSIARVREAFTREQRFVGDAAHELKTAIAVVRSSVQLLLLKQRTATEYRVGLERVLEDNSRVESIVVQMLQLARLSEVPGTDAYNPASDLNEVAATAVEQLRPLYEGRGIPVSVERSAAALVPLPHDRALVLTTNLLMNAIQHSEQGAPVRIRLTVSPEAVTMCVEDAGAGISKEAIPYIFDRFYREDVSRARDTGGTGLGLSICRAIVQAAGGDIQVTSSPGRGTRVTVVFTVVRDCV